MTTSRFSRDPVASVTIPGTTSVGGTSATAIDICKDGTIRFTDRRGQLRVIQSTVPYTADYPNRTPEVARAFSDDPNRAMFALVDALIARGAGRAG